jgi:hypothetical protein
VQAEMWETASIEEVQKKLEEADNDTLVIVDCDDTLIRPKDSILQTAHNKELKKLMNKMEKQSKGTAAARYQKIILRDASGLLLSPQWPKILATLQTRGVRILLLSSSLTGDPEEERNLPLWRYQKLCDLGIDFQKSWREVPESVFFCEEEGPLFGERKGQAIFKNGLLLCCFGQKGEALRLFLKSLPQYSFKKIIFVDDVEHNLKSVGKVAHALGMVFVGIKFTLEKERRPDPLDLSIAERQLRFLIQEERWISEEEIRSLENAATPPLPFS